MWINVASVKHYLKAITAIEAKQGALNARKPLVGRREPHLWGLAPTGIHHLLLGNLTTEFRGVKGVVHVPFLTLVN